MPAEDVVRLVPVLTGVDTAPMVAFWERLGFVVTADFDAGGYVILSSDPTWEDPVELHLSRWGEHDPYTTAGAVYLRVQDAAALYESIKADLEAEGLLYLAPAEGISATQTAELRAMDAAGTRYVRLHELVDQEYGQREFAVIDPAGWLVRVGSPIDP